MDEDTSSSGAFFSHYTFNFTGLFYVRKFLNSLKSICGLKCDDLHLWRERERETERERERERERENITITFLRF